MFIVEKTKKENKSAAHPINHTAPIRICVSEIRGHCNFGYCVGDEILFGKREINGEICPEAMITLWPKVYAMKQGAGFVWNESSSEKLTITTPCPDPRNPVWFTLERINEKEE